MQCAAGSEVVIVTLTLLYFSLETDCDAHTMFNINNTMCSTGVYFVSIYMGFTVQKSFQQKNGV